MVPARSSPDHNARLAGGNRMNQSWQFIISLGWACGIAILFVVICAIVVRCMISAFKLHREKVMKVFYLLTCLILMTGNAAYAIAAGFSHSAVVQDQGDCILAPLAWIGKNIGSKRTLDALPFFASIAGMWLVVIIAGLYLARKGRSSFWALLLPPIISIMTVFLSYFMGWEFGRY